MKLLFGDSAGFVDLDEFFLKVGNQSLARQGQANVR